jgi:formamidopyrimidine-DNA glycosylase
MPELPDLLYIRKRLNDAVRGRAIDDVELRQPVILRNALPLPLPDALKGLVIGEIQIRGPFLLFPVGEDIHFIVNLMLAGRLQHQHPGQKPIGHLCLTFILDDATRLHLADEKTMAKAYIVRRGKEAAIPRYAAQGLDVLSPQFTADAFRFLAGAHGRRQVRVFINDHTALSAIGNAYADDILFDAGIHPKTFVGRLSPRELDMLYNSIVGVIRRGCEAVEAAAQPIEVKVRDHMLVRNRKGEPCPRCGGIIRREGVRGHDVFFCPRCQPASRSLFLDWTSLDDSHA